MCIGASVNISMVIIFNSRFIVDSHLTDCSLEAIHDDNGILKFDEIITVYHIRKISIYPVPVVFISHIALSRE